MTPKRDLSGFGGETPSRPRRLAERPPLHPTSEAPLVPPPRKPESAPPKPAGKKKQRITLSLPTAVAGHLRSTADRENRVYLDIVLEAFLEHNDAVDLTFVERRRVRGVQTSGGRRRSDSGRTQIPLNILKEDLREIDGRAERLGLDRSAYVTELLVRSIGH